MRGAHAAYDEGQMNMKVQGITLPLVRSIIGKRTKRIYPGKAALFARRRLWWEEPPAQATDDELRQRLHHILAQGALPAQQSLLQQAANAHQQSALGQALNAQRQASLGHGGLLGQAGCDSLNITRILFGE